MKKEPNIKEIVNDAVSRSTGIVKEYFDSRFKLMYENVEGKFQKINHNIEIINDNIELIKQDLHKKVIYDEFTALEKRVRKLESKKK